MRRNCQEAGNRNMTTLLLSPCYRSRCHLTTGTEGLAWCIRPCCRTSTISAAIRCMLAARRQWLKLPTEISLDCAAFRKKNSFQTHSPLQPLQQARQKRDVFFLCASSPNSPKRDQEWNRNLMGFRHYSIRIIQPLWPFPTALQPVPTPCRNDFSPVLAV